MITTILEALIAIPRIAGYVESFASAVTSWWISRQTTKTLSAIADAAALSASATSQAERDAALVAWQKALSQPRVSP